MLGVFIVMLTWQDRVLLQNSVSDKTGIWWDTQVHSVVRDFKHLMGEWKRQVLERAVVFHFQPVSHWQETCDKPNTINQMQAWNSLMSYILETICTICSVYTNGKRFCWLPNPTPGTFTLFPVQWPFCTDIQTAECLFFLKVLSFLINVGICFFGSPFLFQSEMLLVSGSC